MYSNLVFNKKTINNVIMLASVMAIVLFSLRFTALLSDVSGSFAVDDVGYHIDEGYKTLAARNQVVHGRTNWNDADEYEGWFGKSILTQLLYVNAFQLGGVSLDKARLVTLIFSFLLLVIYIFVYKNAYSVSVLILGLGLFLTEPYLYFYSKVALFEFPIAFFLAMSFFFIFRYQNKSFFLYFPVFIGLAVFSTLLIKPSAFIYSLPAICALIGLEIINRVNLSSFRLGLYSCIGLLLIGLLLYFTQDVWIRRMGLTSESSIQDRFFTNPIFEWSPVIMLCAFLCVFHGVASKSSKYLKNPYRMALLSTVVGVPVILAFLPYGPSRYYAAMMVAPVLLIIDYFGSGVWEWRFYKKIHWLNHLILGVLGILIIWSSAWCLDLLVLRTLLPLGDDPGISGVSMIKWILPLAVISGCFLSFVYRINFAKKLVNMGLYISLGITIFYGIAQQINQAMHPSFFADTIAKKLEAVVPEKSSIAGDLAPYFGLRANRDSLYVNHVFNPVTNFKVLQPDYFLSSSTSYDIDTLQQLEALKWVSSDCSCPLGKFMGKQVKLYQLDLNGAGVCLIDEAMCKL